MRATGFLKSGLTHSAEFAAAIWSLVSDEHGAEMLDLTIAEPGGSVSQRFAPDELDDQFRMESRLSRLWDRLLEDRIHRSRDRVNAMLHELEAEPA